MAVQEISSGSGNKILVYACPNGVVGSLEYTLENVVDPQYVTTNTLSIRNNDGTHAFKDYIQQNAENAGLRLEEGYYENSETYSAPVVGSVKTKLLIVLGPLQSGLTKRGVRLYYGVISEDSGGFQARAGLVNSYGFNIVLRKTPIAINVVIAKFAGLGITVGANQTFAKDKRYQDYEFTLS